MIVASLVTGIIRGARHSAVARFFFGQMAPDTLCVLRVLIGAYLTMSLLFMLPFVMRYMPDGAPIAFDLVRREADANTVTLLAFIRDPLAIFFLHCIAIAAAVCMTIGRWTRLSTVTLYVIYLSYMGSALYAWDGGDGLTTNILFLLSLAALAGHTQVAYAADATVAKRRGEHVPATIPAWSLRLLQLQLCVMYFFSGWYKTQYVEWQNGEALHYVFQQLAFLILPLHHLSAWPVFITLLTSLVVFLELTAPFLLWIRPFKAPVLVALFLLHLGIRAGIHVFAFGITLPFLIIFVEPDTARRWVKRITESMKPHVND